MRLLVYGDLQATDGDALCHTQPNMTLQHYRVRKFFNDIRRIYTQHRCDGLVDLGDTTDDRSSIPVPTLDLLCDGLSTLPDGTNLKLIGNHEQFLRDTTVNNHRLFESKFTVVENNEVLKLGDYAAFFCSYPSGDGALAAWLMQNIQKYRTSRKILFGHFQAEGSITGGGMALKGVPLALLRDNFEMVLLGHIHGRQALADNVYHVGSPFQQNWGEAGEKKYVVILDTRTLELEWVEMTGYPLHKTVSFEEYRTLDLSNTEDRYRVRLDNHEQAEAFFASPTFHRCEGVYNYDETPAMTEDGEIQTDFSFSATCRRYLSLVPPAEVGIKLPDDEMLEIAQTIAQ